MVATSPSLVVECERPPKSAFAASTMSGVQRRIADARAFRASRREAYSGYGSRRSVARSLANAASSATASRTITATESSGTAVRGSRERSSPFSRMIRPLGKAAIIARSWSNRLLHQLGVLVREVVHEADRGRALEALLRVPIALGFTEVIADDLAPNVEIGVHVFPLHVRVPEHAELVHSVFVGRVVTDAKLDVLLQDPA